MSRLSQESNTIKRKYSSKRRLEQARDTQMKIVAAARVLFIDRGYSGATLESIAVAAGVAVETVYASFGNKPAILSRVIEMSVLGDAEPVPLFQREGPQAVVRETDQRRQIQLFARDMGEIMSRMAPMFGVMRAAAKMEPDIAEMLQKVLDERVGGMKFFLRALMENGPLREGYTLDSAAETVWAVSSGEVYTLLVTDRSWEVQKYVTWLAETLTRLLLP